MVDELSLVTFNARGLREVKKRRAIFRHMHIKYPRHLVILQECHSSTETERQWKAEWGTIAFFAHGSEKARGIGILFPRNFNGETDLIHADEQGRLIAVRIFFNSLSINLVGIYAPTQNSGREQVVFYQNLNNFLQTLDVSNPLILCGDMNVHLTELDTSSSHYRLTQPASILRSIIDEFDLIDIWRELNPGIRRFSWRRCRPLQQSRIDYFLISKALEESHQVIRTDINPGIRSDHSIVSLVIEIASSKRGPGLWRFDLTLLDNSDVVRLITEEIVKAKERREAYVGVDGTGVLLETLFGNIRGICVCKGAQIVKEKRADENRLEQRAKSLEIELANYANDIGLIAEYEEVKAELDEFKNKAAVRAMLRTKGVWLEQGERPTKYFLSLEKKRNAERTINMLENEQGNYIVGDRNILKFCKDYFEKVHSSKNISEESILAFTEGIDIPVLSDHDRDQCEGLITAEECHEALRNMASHRAPSVSGLNKEFILFFWDDLKEIIVNYINEAYNDKCLFITQRRGVITLLPKPGDKKQIKNKRPICLLDIVYKIIAKVLAKRLSFVIKNIVSPDQTGFLKGRSIQDNLRLIQDVIEYTNYDNTPGILCALDFKSAFNSVEHKFLFHALRVFGFGESFIQWIKILYTKNELTVINNGYISDWFCPKRGIMQGCPISGMLFTLAVELLAIRIRNSDEIKGIRINNVTVTISQYCDDATVFVQDEESVKKLVQLLHEYGSISGLELNVSKSKLMWLGSLRLRNSSVEGIKPVEKLKILGMWYSAVRNCEKDNVEPIVKSIVSTINMWGQRDLSIKGRITVSKSLLISKLIYIMPTVMLSSEHLHQIRTLIMKFIWRGRPPKVKAAVICQGITRGGLNAINVEILYRSLRICWIKKVLRHEVAWVKLLQARCHPIRMTDLIKCRYVKSDLEKFRLLPFYLQMLVEYRLVNQEGEPSDVSQIKREQIWLNEFIKCDGDSILDKNMYMGGIRRINDLVDNSTGQMMNFSQFRRKYPTCRISYLRYFGIVSAIPGQWKELIRRRCSLSIQINENAEPFMINNNKCVPVTAFSTKLLYNALRVNVTPTANSRWEYQGLVPEDWSVIYSIPYTCTASTKLQSFQYQVLHRYIPTRKFLHLRGIVDSARCINCDGIDSLVHYFFTCHTTCEFWKTVFRFMNSRLRASRVRCTVMNVMFGVPDSLSVVNLIILCGKHYVHTRKMRDQALCFNAFKSYLKYEYEAEKYVARIDEKKVRACGVKWKMFCDAFQD